MLGLTPGPLSQCSLYGRIERAEKLRSVLFGNRRWPAGIYSEFPEVPRYFTPSECVAYVHLRKLLAGRRDDARTFLQTA